MLLLIINECNECEKNFGLININSLKNIIAKSKLFDFDCLSFISFSVATIFNQLQMQRILEELHILRYEIEIDKLLLDTIQEAIQFGLTDNYMYLKFEVKDNI